MKNQKIPTWLGTVVIIIFAITVYIFICKIENNNKQCKPKIQNEVTQRNNRKESKAQIPTSDWKTCKNEKSNYEFRYPSEWLIVDRYRAILDDCYNPADPRSSGLFIGSDPYQSGRTFGITISAQEDLKDTIYKGVTSLDEYYSRNDRLLESRTKMKETSIDGERADWFKEGNDNKTSVWFFHNKTLYEIRSDVIDQRLLEMITESFQFPND